MRITIKYEASWRNSFLDGSNNEPLPKNGRPFVGSMTTLGKRDGNGNYPNFIKREITHDTVMGILNRLIGDQRKLYQSRNCPNYFFLGLEDNISFDDQQNAGNPINTETVYIRNMEGNTDQNSFSGMIKGNHPAFISDYSREFWGVLWLSFEELKSFLTDSSFAFDLPSSVDISLSSVLERSLYLRDVMKPMTCDEAIINVVSIMKTVFPEEKYIEADKLKPIRLYAAALYIQLERLKKKYDMTTACNRRGTNTFVYGYSKRGFNGTRDFMKNFVTGGEKPIWGNPYKLDRRNTEGVSLLTKANGTLDIHIDIPENKAQQLKEMIEAAGVSSFYLGKKGLAYVDVIR
ncbi:type I-Fv CRISPR-associated protein Cas5fv [Methylomonas rapida]|uniref:Type I-Fv CRISPR-associated protein Cas5fv n=1 Tax=Methylomonas rapida TaxID=2963939 RepID=A0ABY7GQT6_9GAMM|nr:type I-Fv CRISPR-associated protein Cas5fv [Methylomonas rapida]WAR46885.1 type I-Fv CRISPR-associated protein Cas5fv [Methylomonas rapida]